jgi:hypothetical protein
MNPADYPSLEDIAAITRKPAPMFPWSYATEDRWAAQEAVMTLYASLQLPKPRFAWCPSPAAMHAASRMLRTVQAGSAYNMVQALVPQDGNKIEREARVSLLAAMIDPDVTTQSGGLIINMIAGVFGRPSGGPSQALSDLRDLLRFEEKDPSGTVAPARFREQSLWPSFYPGFSVPRLSALQRQALIIMPFTKLCWLCRPPDFLLTDSYDRLHAVGGPAAQWSDGFAIYCDRTPKEDRLESGAALALPESTDCIAGGPDAKD